MRSPFADYLAACHAHARPALEEVLAAIRRSAPEAEEKISYRMPSFHHRGVLVYVGAFKRHIGLYPPVRDKALRLQAAPYAGPKGNLQFPLDAPMPLPLIEQIVEAAWRDNEARAAAKGRETSGTVHDTAAR